MDRVGIAEIVSAVAVVFGFAVSEVKRYRDGRARGSALALGDDFFSGPIILSWKKLEALVQEMRGHDGRDTYFEWFQWLAERIHDRESAADPIPAHIEHRAWLPGRKR